MSIFKSFIFEMLGLILIMAALKCYQYQFEFHLPVAAFLIMTAVNVNNYARGNK